MPTLIAMRHAPPNDTSVYCGNNASICPDALDSLGEAIRCLRDHPQTHIFVSPQTRARETAQLLVSQADIQEECFFDSRLRAKDYGQMQGKKKAFIHPHMKNFLINLRGARVTMMCCCGCWIFWQSPPFRLTEANDSCC